MRIMCGAPPAESSIAAAGLADTAALRCVVVGGSAKMRPAMRNAYSAEASMRYRQSRNTEERKPITAELRGVWGSLLALS